MPLDEDLRARRRDLEQITGKRILLRGARGPVHPGRRYRPCRRYADRRQCAPQLYAAAPADRRRRRSAGRMTDLDGLVAAPRRQRWRALTGGPGAGAGRARQPAPRWLSSSRRRPSTASAHADGPAATGASARGAASGHNRGRTGKEQGRRAGGRTPRCRTHTRSALGAGPPKAGPAS